MRIIFISSTCSPKHYEEICNKRKYAILDSSQKFFDMFLKGFKNRNDIEIECICVAPLSHGTYPDLVIKEREEKLGNINYYSVSFINYTGIKSITAGFRVKKRLKEIIARKNDKTVIVTDPLLLEATVPALKVGKKFGIQVIGFLTDLPDFADQCDELGFIKTVLYKRYNKKSAKCLAEFNKYVFLTEAMSKAVNGNNRPWLLMECLVDCYAVDGGQKKNQTDKPSVMYAGKLHKQFGLDILAKAIEKVKSDCRFDIYGDGNFRGELEKIADKNKNVFIHGIVPVAEVMQAERNSTLLINPRMSNGEFTKYSFPSKTAEYMLSGTPVLMFKLPGIPDEYDNYLNYAKNETADSLALEIDRLLERGNDILTEKGESARRFIIENKNNITQAERFIEFCLK